MLEEPSRGSKQTTYFPFLFSSHIISFSYSSVHIAQTLWQDLKLEIKTSSDSTSSFFYESPVALTSPANPYKFVIPAFLTFEEINLQAIWMDYINNVKSPEGWTLLYSALFYCLTIMCLVKVTISVLNSVLSTILPCFESFFGYFFIYWFKIINILFFWNFWVFK